MSIRKSCIYTCLSGNYDGITQPPRDERFDYFVFSDTIEKDRVGVWKVIKIPSSINKSVTSRLPKILPHKYLRDYEYSLYIDSNLEIADRSFYDLIIKKMNLNILFSLIKHPYRTKTLDELKQCFIEGKVSLAEYRKEKDVCKRNDMTGDGVLYENGILLRKHNDNEVVKIDEEWWNNYCQHVKRDQLWLCPVFNKYKFKPDLLFPEGISVRNSSMINYHQHNNRGVKYLRYIILKGRKIFSKFL